MKRFLKSRAVFRNTDIAVSLVLIALFAGGCSSAQPRNVQVNEEAVAASRERSLEDRVAAMQAELVSLRNDQGVRRTEADDLRRRVASLEEKLVAAEESAKHQREAGAELARRVAAAETELAEARGALKVRAEQLDNAQRMQQELAVRCGELQKDIDALKARAAALPPDRSAFECRVSKVSDKIPTLTLNKGSEQGVKRDDQFDIYDDRNVVIGRVKVWEVYDDITIVSILEQTAGVPFAPNQRAVRVAK